MLKKFIRLIGGDTNKKQIDKSTEIVDQINTLETQYEALSDGALSAKTSEFRARLAQGETLDDLLPEAFAAVREASKRTIGLRHYDVQLIGGMTLHQGQIAEMRTGEGKTLVATLPLYLNALTGKGAHLITVNDYLARRDARWMAPIYNMLGMNVGVLQMAARTENGKKAFLVDLEHTSPHEDQNQLRMLPRVEAYAADITYGTNSEFGFDYLRDNMTMSLDERVQRGHYFAIVDEVDNVLIDEARTPLIISGPAQDEAEWYIHMAQVVRQLRPEDCEISEKDHNVSLTEVGESHVEELLGVPLRDPERPEDATPEQARTFGYLEQALRAQFLFRRNKDYLVQAGKVIIIDEFTGRQMPGRRWSDGLHQAVEAKEGARVQNESVTYATITIQNYFRMYSKLAGMTGTAMTEAEEFHKIYNLEVLAIPTNLEYQAMRAETGLIETESRDTQNYKYQYYARRDDPEKKPIFWKRQDYPDAVYRTEEMKLRVLAREILRDHILGRPALVGTTSVEMSERVSARLKADPLRRLCQAMLLRQTWMTQNNREEDGRQIPELQFLNGPLQDIETAEMRKLARELNLPFNPEDSANLDALLALLELPVEGKSRLASDLSGGVPHQVLNARKHTEESQVIAGAGAFGAVTIATNMAGRGVDIKLGGELPENVLSNVNRVLRRNGYHEAYDMNMQERRQALQSLSPDAYGIYGEQIAQFMHYLDQMEQVKRLGGLHVIGSERHEARRIDNQLRGRSARQGDPGSSRFYLSMQDELMRLFGGQQAESMMDRLKVDDALPLEIGLVSRIVEQAQTRVEGHNFDMRKHLLEYDDVLNAQRASIYAQRDRIFTKEDLTDDVTDMLRTEVLQRVPAALQTQRGSETPPEPWRLLAWLDQIQPFMVVEGKIFPSYSQRLLLDQLLQRLGQTPNSAAAQTALLDLARSALEAEKEHHVQSFRLILEQTEERLRQQIDERMEAVDTFFDGLEGADETDTRRPAELLAELSSAVHMPLRLSAESQRALRDDPDAVSEEVRDQVVAAQQNQAITRLVGSVERRLDESLEINSGSFTLDDWNELTNQVLDAVRAIFDRRIERYIGEGGSIVKDLENAMARLPESVNEQVLLGLLLNIPQGARAAFDKKTHRRVFQRTMRLTYIYYAGSLLENSDPEEVGKAVLAHLEAAQQAMRRDWGSSEFSRLGTSSLSDLPESVRQVIVDEMGAPNEQALHLTLNSLPEEHRQIIADVLGRRALSVIYRQVLLNVITQLWVDYLTQMESLRVSIGLEAYAQRDPLVQYKSRASELFQNLLSAMRLDVITRMFTYRPRDLGNLQTSVSRGESGANASKITPGAASSEQPSGDSAASPASEERQISVPASQRSSPDEPVGGKKKRRRH